MQFNKNTPASIDKFARHFYKFSIFFKFTNDI
jgi:hypothetical protein